MSHKTAPCTNGNPSYYLLNTKTNEFYRAPCNRYDCQVCGRRKLAILQKALISYFKRFKYIRLFTFTLRYNLQDSKSNHYRNLQESFRRFTTEIRRNKALTRNQRNFQYVRVIDLHKSGFVHFHCLFTEYLPINLIQNIWNNICNDVVHDSGKVGNVNAVGLISSHTAAYYVTKYIFKASQELCIRCKFWTRSGKCKILPPKKKNSDWIFLRWQDVFVTDKRSRDLISIYTSSSLTDNVATVPMRFF